MAGITLPRDWPTNTAIVRVQQVSRQEEKPPSRLSNIVGKLDIKQRSDSKQEP